MQCAVVRVPTTLVEHSIEVQTDFRQIRVDLCAFPVPVGSNSIADLLKIALFRATFH